MKKMLISLVVIVLSSSIALLAAEGLLTLFPGLMPAEVRQIFNDKGAPHPTIGTLPVPGSHSTIITRDFATPYRIDDHGFRNQEPWPEEADLVVVGDSLVFGYGVDVTEAWPQLVADLTTKRVVNLGLVGGSPQQYLRIYESFAQDLDPDVTLIGFFARNDFWDARMFADWQDSGVGGNYLVWRTHGRLTEEELDNPIARLTAALSEHSYLANLAKYGWEAIKRPAANGAVAVNMPDGSALWLYKDDYREKTRFSTPGNEVFNIVIDSLTALQKATTTNGSRLLIVFQPAKEEVYRQSPDQSYPDASQALRNALDRLGIEYLNLAPAFRERAEAGEVLYFPTDGHPNARGYALIAELVGQYIEAHPLPDLQPDH